jgi:WhiB family redox-sensing transcriptional regulator
MSSIPFIFQTPTFFKDALCKGAPQDWFFPEFSGNHRGIRQAKQLCSTCPVSDKCLEYGKETLSSGVWGGITLDRGNIRRRKKSTNQQQKEETK